MSVYKDCSAAVEVLKKDPPVEQHNGAVFTELDVVNKAANAGWSTKLFEKGASVANQVLGTQYRARKLARYGPVELPNGHRDYARIGTKIAYADAETGPEFWETPNGRFPKLRVEDDPLKAQGRKHSSNRNDLAPWDAQDLTVVSLASVKEITQPSAAELRENGKTRIEELEEQLAQANERVRRAEAKVNGNSNGDGDIDTVLGLLEDIDGRLKALEDVEEKRRQIVYAAQR